MANQLRIGLIDADQDIRLGRKMAINAHPDLSVVFEIDNARAALEKVPEALVDVLVIDYRTRGMSGTDLASRLVRDYLGRGERCPAIIITGPYASDELRLESIRKGATDFISQDLSMAELIKAVLSSQAKTEEIDLDSVTKLFQSSSLKVDQNEGLLIKMAAIPELERRVLDEFVAGLNDAEIAQKFGLSNLKIRKAFEVIKANLGCSTRAQLALLLFEAGLLKARVQDE